jgi:hypothetical protein
MTTTFKNQLQAGVGPSITLTATAVQPSTPSVGSVTFTFTTQPITPFPVGSYISVSGSSIAGFNGPFGPVTAATTGSVTVTNVTTGISTGAVTLAGILFSTNSSAKTTVIGFSLTNTTGFIVTASVQLVDTVANTTASYISAVPIPANQSLRVVNGGERLVLGPSTNIVVNVNQSSSVDVVLSIVEIS